MEPFKLASKGIIFRHKDYGTRLTQPKRTVGNALAYLIAEKEPSAIHFRALIYYYMKQIFPILMPYAHDPDHTERDFSH